MVSISLLPECRTCVYDSPVSGSEVAEDAGLAETALAILIDGVLKDLDTVIVRDVTATIVTVNNPEALQLLRHDAAHVLAEAVQELYPDTQVAFGPATDTGFYYDFARTTPFTPGDLEQIETRMREIVDRNEPIQREVWSREEATLYFRDKGERYKAEWVAKLPTDEAIYMYRQGRWIDLCRGPHLPSTGKLGKAFKLLSLSGSYWLGDSRNGRLQRIHGTCWPDEKQLEDYLLWTAEVERRDHRHLGRSMKLFHLQEEAAGSVFWHPDGYTLYRTLEVYIRQQLTSNGYVEVKTPLLVNKSLWELSGHWEKFREHMFMITAGENETLAIKPMNCPCHVQIFRHRIRSYRELPLRMAEFGSCHRYEPSGALHGLMRVRSFTQDDAHIFCTENQILSESQSFCNLLLGIYRDFGFTNVRVKFSDRPSKRSGPDEVWDKAESALLEASKAAGLELIPNPGEGAFYGPKLEFVLKDALNRDWQCGTLQVDFVLPERLDAAYIGLDGTKHRPVILHRAILGSFERFIGILLEHYAGILPLWLAPVQIAVVTIVSNNSIYAGRVVHALKEVNLRVKADFRNEKINLKVREHSLAKVPIILVIGDKESEQDTVTMRRMGTKQQETLSLNDVVNLLRCEAAMPGLGSMLL